MLVNVSGAGRLKSVVVNGVDTMHQENEFDLTLTATQAVTIQRCDLLIAGPGGWIGAVWSLYTDYPVLAGEPKVLAPNQSIALTSVPLSTGSEVSHAVIRVVASGAKRRGQDSLTPIPLLRAGYEAPAEILTGDPPYVCFWTNPLEVMDVWHAGQKRRWINVGGMIFNPAQLSMKVISLAVVAVADGNTFFQHVENKPRFEDANIGFKEIKPAADGSVAVSTTLAPFIYGYALDNCPASFQTAHVQVAITYMIGKVKHAMIGMVPIVMADSPSMLPPIRGQWSFGNAPDHYPFDSHTVPWQRLALDISQAVNGSTLKPGVVKNNATNTDFYAYGQPVYAAAAGKVVSADDTNAENTGYTPLMGGVANYICIQSGDRAQGYFHVRKDFNCVKVGDTVSVGQIIGQVGNSGSSSEPHLHFEQHRIDSTGRGRPAPLVFYDCQSPEHKVVNVVPGNGQYLVLPPKIVKKPLPGPQG